MALRRMVLQDFVIVQRLDMDMPTGFTALTGETGAGKSMLVDALQLVMGARAEASVVREGCTRADITAEFDATDAATAYLRALDIDTDDGLVLLRRTVDAAGKSRGWLNGTPVTATQLRELGALLVDIHGQHAWQSLMQPASARSLLDAYGRIDTTALHAHWRRWQDAQARLDAALQGQQTQQQEAERLQWQVAEVGKLAPAAHEWDSLNTEHQRLSHAQQLIDAAALAYQQLNDDNGILSQLHTALQALQAQSDIEPQFADSAALLESCQAQLQEVQRDLQTYLDRTELDPARLQTLDDRLSQWMGLARRFKLPPDALPATYAQWVTRLQELEHDVDIDALRTDIHHAQADWQAEAARVSAQRQHAAQRLSASVTTLIQDLGMAGGQFVAHVQAAAQPSAHGQDAIDFLVAGHSGTAPRPLAKVASGGELSRLALALAVTTSQLGQAPTLIFDEIDSGIGGVVAHSVGRLMRQLGQDRQVLAVTHLAQVAASAHQQIRVFKHSTPPPQSKNKSKNTTTTNAPATTSTAELLTPEQRQQELARMLGGEHLSPTSLAHAAELLHSSQQP